MVVALLVCVVSVANLNYFKPHRNSIVQKVAQASFLLTTCKYVLAIVLIDVSKSERLILGGVLVFLDICFVLGSLGSIVAVFCLLKSHLDSDVDKQKKEVNSTTKVVPTTVENVLSVPKKVEDEVNRKIREKEIRSWRTESEGIIQNQVDIKRNKSRRVPRNSVQHLF